MEDRVASFIEKVLRTKKGKNLVEGRIAGD